MKCSIGFLACFAGTVVFGAPTAQQLISGRIVNHAVPAFGNQLSSVRLLNEPLSAVRLVNQPQAVTLTAAPGPAQYNYGYSVSDSLTGDSKTRQESRDGDVVSGSYSVLQPDGRLRTVTYTADKLHGFQAKVRYDGEAGPVAIPIDTPNVAFDNSNVISVVREVPHGLQAIQNNQAVSVVRQIPQAVRVHAVHNTPAVSVVRQVPQAVHAVHNTPAVSIVRQVPQAVHALHNTPAVSVVRQVPQTVLAVHNTPAVSVVRQVPQAVHAVHSTPSASVVRQVPQAVNTFQPTSSLNTSNLQSLFGNSGLDLSQFRFISPVNLLQN